MLRLHIQQRRGQKAFKAQFSEVYPVCSNIFLSRGKTADAETITRCRGIIKENAGILNNFRGTVYAPAACILACSTDPEGKMAKASENYKMLKDYFKRSEYLALTALLLADTVNESETRGAAERGKAIYDLMNEKHRFLTGYEDSIFALTMAFSEKSIEQLTDEMELCMEELDGISSKNTLQTVAQILVMSDRPAKEKCARFKELFEALRASGLKYGKYYELPVLASLAVTDKDISEIISDISDVDGFLAKQKGYGGLFGLDKKSRLMHAAMIVSSLYSPCSPSSSKDIASLASMISIVAMQIIMIIVISNSVAMSVSASH
ncbi:MAG: DUF4003 family protein [Clostridia bacterium]|nr:DUF4003 family protein [Clostridia bacterium]